MNDGYQNNTGIHGASVKQSFQNTSTLSLLPFSNSKWFFGSILPQRSEKDAGYWKQ